MIIYTSGNLFESEAEALVNTVNCEGYMGKGIAYQFKNKYPENNLHYVKACKNNEIGIGKLVYFKEKGKLIINFPTKDKWRAKSKIEYIEKGLEDFKKVVKELDIKSVALPPLGAGNGGLAWAEVKEKIESHLADMEDRFFYIYEPTQNYVAQEKEEPKLSLSALVLMDMKNELKKFDSTRLQKTAFFMNLFIDEDYFKFIKHRYGPYDHSIKVISQKIKDFQNYHKVKNTNEAYGILYNKLISKSVDTKLNELKVAVRKSANYVNSLESNKDLECVSTIAYILTENKTLDTEELIAQFKNWSKEKAERFSTEEILKGIDHLKENDIIEENLLGYSINHVYNH